MVLTLGSSQDGGHKEEVGCALDLSQVALDHDRLGLSQRRQLGWENGWRLNPGPCGLGTELGGRDGVPPRCIEIN